MTAFFLESNEKRAVTDRLQRRGNVNRDRTRSCQFSSGTKLWTMLWSNYPAESVMVSTKF